jgi:hypothetical protein
MADYIGPKQRPIIEAMKDDGWLQNHEGRWSLFRGTVWWRSENRERCMALYVRGFIMADGYQGSGIRYVLTEKGKAA